MSRDIINEAYELMTTTKSEHVKLTIADLLQHIDDMTSDDAQRSHDADRQYMDLWQKYKSTRVEIADLRRAMGFVNAIAN